MYMCVATLSATTTTIYWYIPHCLNSLNISVVWVGQKFCQRNLSSISLEALAVQPAYHESRVIPTNRHDRTLVLNLNSIVAKKCHSSPILSWTSVLSLAMQMYLSLVLAMERLSKAALAKSRETKEKVITERHIKLIFKVSFTCSTGGIIL